MARNTGGRRVSWLNLVLYFSYSKCTAKLGYTPLSAVFRANLDRKRQIWPAAWWGLHYVRPHKTMSCYSCCDCQCFTLPQEFDAHVVAETRFTWRLYDICHSNIGWYTDKSICDEHLIENWIQRESFGIYVLWHKDDYCAEHEMFHMRALYVGKGKIGKRLLTHWKQKDFSEEMLVYWTFIALPNRQAKYCEQLLLDVYKIPRNKYEATGTLALCAHLTQGEVD